MQRRRFRKSLPYLLPSGTGTTLFYTAPFLVMLLYAFSGGGGLAALGGNHAFAVGARNTAVYLFCGIGAALLLPGSALMYLALASIDRFRTNRIVCGILRGAKPASLALMLVALWAFLGLSVFAGGAFSALAAALVLLSLVLTLKKWLNPVWLIVLMALAAVAVRTIG